MDTSSVPKFGSFKPKTKPKKSVESEPSSRDDTRKNRREEGSERPITHHDHREQTRRERGRDPRDTRDHVHRPQEPDRQHRDSGDHHRGCPKRSPEPGVNSRTDAHQESKVSQRPSEAAFEESDLFFIDRRGDSKNIEYGSLHRYSIPAYRRTGHGNVVGIDNIIKIDREASTDKEVCLMNVRKDKASKLPRLLTSKHGRSKESQCRFILPNSNNYSYEDNNLQSDYIDLRSSRKRKRGSETPEPGNVDYRSIEGKAKAQPDDEDVTYVSDSEVDNVDRDLGLAARLQNAVLSKQTKAKPQDVNSWLALIEHQAKLVQPGNETAVFTSSKRRTLADLRISLTREALGHISKGMPGHDSLLLALIKEGNFVWDSSKRATQWQQALSECSSSTLLWTSYLDYIQHSHNDFRYETCKEAYMKCLSMLHVASEKVTGDDLNAIFTLQAYVLLRYAAYVREAGYGELSVAIWQAVLEWNLQLPNELKSATLQDRLAAFEDFWDSECPRLGEQHAAGWQTYHLANAKDIRSPDKPPITNTASRQLDELVAEEAEWSMSLYLSTTADDDAAVEDPFRYVMFSDIREVLETCDGLSGTLLIHAALCFLGLPMISSMDASAVDLLSWIRDPHLVHTPPLSSSTDFGIALSNALTAKSKLESVESLFEEVFPQNFYAHGFADRMLEQLLATHFDEGLAEYYLAFKCRYFSTQAAKAAKHLLKSHPSSLRLYNAYALMLVTASEGRDLQKPLQVWSTAVHMRADLPDNKQDDVVFLWHSRSLCLAKHTNDGRACLASLMTICETGGDARMKQLKVQRELESGFDRMQLASKLVHTALYADLLAWLAYLTSDNSIETALDTYHKYELLLSRPTTLLSLEHLLQHKVKLIDLHISHKRPYKPALIRQELNANLLQFPSNSTILDLRYRLSPSDRLRDLINPTTISSSSSKPAPETQENIIQWTHKLTAELHRANNSECSGSTTNNIQAHFTHAVLSPDSSIKSSPLMWILWLEWEYSQYLHFRPAHNSGTTTISRTIKKNKNKTSDNNQNPLTELLRRTKQVFLDGMRNLPWHKGFVIRGLQIFCQVLGDVDGNGDGSGDGNANAVVTREELRQWWDVLIERGLRVRGEV